MLESPCDDPELDRLWKLGRLAEACTVSARALAPLARLEHPFRDPAIALEVARRWHVHGMLCSHDARIVDADRAFSHAHAIRRELDGEDHPDTLATLARLAGIAGTQRRHELADQRFAAALAGLAAQCGDASVRVAIVRRDHAAYLRDRASLADARAQLDRALAVLARELPANHPDHLAALEVEATLLAIEGALPAAAARAAHVLELGREVWTDDHPLRAITELIIAVTELGLGDYRSAEQRLVRVRAQLARGLREHHPTIAVAMRCQAQAVAARGGSLERAATLAEAALAIYRETYPDRTGAFARTLFDILFASARPVDAADLAIELAPDLDRETSRVVASRLANWFLEVRDYRRALPWIERARDATEPGDVRARWTACLARWTAHVHDRGR